VDILFIDLCFARWLLPIKSIANSGTERWSNQQQFALWLWFVQDVINLAFCFYLSSLNQNPAAVVPAEGNSNSPPSAILNR
jgi:hypothetical protein